MVGLMNLPGDDDEIPLDGGWTAASVVRIGPMVHRTMGERAPFVHRLLEYLEEIGFVGVPRLRGIDGRGREMLTYLAGEMGHRRPFGSWSDEQLRQVARFLRLFHDATGGTDLAGDAEVVCHNDFAPWNVVLDGDAPVGLIDFDDAAPGPRLRDLSYACWCWPDVGGASREPGELARRVRLMCDTYGASGTISLDRIVPEIADRMAENIARQLGNGKLDGAARVAVGRDWLLRHQDEVRGHLMSLSAARGARRGGPSR